MKFFKKNHHLKTYDPNHQKPVLKTSICTGEQVAGFKDLQTGKIEEDHADPFTGRSGRIQRIVRNNGRDFQRVLTKMFIGVFEQNRCL